MSSDWQRWIPLTGVLFVILAVIGFGLLATPDGSDSDQQILNWYNDSGHQTSQLVGIYVFAVAGIAMLLFVNRLHSVVAAAEGARPIFAPFIQVGGAVFVASMVVAAAALGAVSAELTIGDTARLNDPDIGRFFPVIGYGAVLVAGMFPLIFAMFTTAYASMRFNIFASWFNWLTIICGIVLFFAIEFLPLIALLVWMLAATFVLMKRQPSTVTA